MIYPLIRNLLFLLPPEAAHKASMTSLDALVTIPGVSNLLQKQFGYQDAAISKKVAGLQFSNPIGLGAGFDKNAQHLNALEALGFGFVEIGTVTPKAQVGNPSPRLFRLPTDKALINRMGFNNDGVEKIAARLKKRKASMNSTLIIGGNIGKNKITENEEAWRDYCINFKGLEEVVDYFVINVSSPNTPGLRALQDKESLRKIISELQNLNHKQIPIFLKIAPDLELSALDDIISLTSEVKLEGIVSSNTTLDRTMLNAKNQMLAEQIGAGGLSGKPLFNKSNEVLSYLHKGINGRIPIIASGGIFSGEDAIDKINRGADLVQIWTGFIYQGPQLIKDIATSIAKLK